MRRLIDRWSRFVVRRRWVAMALILIITLVSLAGFGKLYFYNNFTSWLAKDDPVLSLFIETSEKFSTNELVMILICPDRGVFNKETFSRITTFTEKMRRRRQVFLVTSMSNISDIRKIEGGIEVKNLLEDIPQTPAAMEKFKEYVLSKESYRGNVVSVNGEWAAISIFVSSEYDSEEVVKTIIFPEAREFFAKEAKIYFAGIPSDAHFLNRFAIDDLSLLTPLIFIIIALILYLSFRSLKGVLFPSLVVLLSSVWLFGLIGYLGAPLTFIMTAIPVLLTALGSAYGIHVLNKFNHDLIEAASDQKKRLVRSTAAIFVPVILAGMTTVVGFLSFRSAKLNLVADFGMFAAIGILFAIVIALTLIPALSVSARFRMRRVDRSDLMTDFLSKLADFVIKYKVVVFLVSLIILGLFAAAIPRIKKEINFVEYFPRKSQPRLAHNIVEDNFSGAYPVYFDIQSKNVRDPVVLRLLRRCENYLLSIENLSTPASIASLVQELNFQLNNRYAIPDSEASVGNLWFFVDGRDEIKQLLSEDNRETVVFAKSAESSTSHNKHLSAQIEAFLERNFRRGLYRYDKKRLTAEIKSRVFHREVDFLSEEIGWLARHYLKRDIDLARVHDVLSRVPFLMDSPPQNEVLDRQKRVVSQYIVSDTFDFLVEQTLQKKIAAAVNGEIEGRSFTQAGVVKILARLVPPGEFDGPTADMVAETLAFKLKEARENWLADKIWRDLNRRFGSDGKEFEKRIKSVVYDLLDDAAVIPEAEIGGIAGQKVEVSRIEQSGIPALLARLDHFLTTSQIQSLILAYLITLVLMIFMRRSFVLGLISTIPIAMTITVIYGFLGHSGIALDYATMMTGGVSIGVGIDYAIHFIHGVLSGTDSGLTLEQAIKNTTVEKGKAILANAMAVMAGFAVLLLSAMVILRNFSATMMGSMFLAALSALTVLPSALLILKPLIIKKLGGKK